MPQAKLLQAAWEDLSNIADYHLREVGPLSAERVTDRLLDAIELLSDNPYLGPLHGDHVLQRRGFRKLVCGQYVCVYRVDEGVPTVYRIFPGSADYTRNVSTRGSG